MSDSKSKKRHALKAVAAAGGTLAVALIGAALISSKKDKSNKSNDAQNKISAKVDNGQNQSTFNFTTPTKSQESYSESGSQTTGKNVPVATGSQYRWNSSLGRYGEFDTMGNWHGDDGSHLRGCTQASEGGGADTGGGEGGGDSGGGGG